MHQEDATGARQVSKQGLEVPARSGVFELLLNVAPVHDLVVLHEPDRSGVADALLAAELTQVVAQERALLGLHRDH